MSTNIAIEFLDAAPARRQDAPALRELRDGAYQHFLTNGLPTRRNENWKYTNLRNIARGQFSTQPAPVASIEIPQIKADELALVSFVDGKLQQRQPAPGLSLHLLSELGDTLAGDLAPGKLVDFDTHPMAALNTAYFDDAIVIDVYKDQHFRQPLLLEFATTASAASRLICPRVIIRVGENASLRVIERFVGMDGATSLTNAVTEVHLSRGARLDHYRLQEHAADETAMTLLRVNQQADSTFSARSVDIGGRLVRNDVHVSLAAPGASCQLSGFYLCLGRQHIDNHTRIDHDAPDTNSNEKYNGVLGDRARGVFNGKVIVKPDAQRIRADQSNRNLLLSGTAEIDTKPELEIYADDVRCTHGATVGQLDEQALFYLRTRGIDERTARALLTFAFAEEVMREIDIASLHDYVEQQVTERLPDHERLAALA